MGDMGMIKGGACLEALLKRKKCRHRRSRSQGRHRSRGLPERRGGRDKKYKANIAPQSITWEYDMPCVTKRMATR